MMLGLGNAKMFTWFAVLALSFTACSRQVVSSSESELNVERPRGHLTISSDSVSMSTTLDPHHVDRFYQYVLMGFEQLVTKDIEGNHIPALAISWEPNNDASSWTIKLREGVLFHDGTEMTADDVAYSLLRLADPDVNSPLLTFFEIVKHIDVLNKYELTVNLEIPSVDFPEYLTSHQASIMRENSGTFVAHDGVGTGPFKLVHLDIFGVTELRAYDDYWNGKPASATASIIAMPDAESRVQAMRSGDLDFLEVSAVQATLFEGDEEFIIQSFPSGNWHGLVMHTDAMPFRDARVRKAIRVAADRQEIVDKALNGNGVVACDHPVWSGDVYHVEIDCPQDIELAKSLLLEAGYSRGLDIKIYTSPLIYEWTAMLETYQRQAAEAGIRLQIIQVPSTSYWTDTWMVRSFTTARWRERSAAQVLPEVYRTGSIWNETFYANEVFDALLDEATSEVDIENRIEIYHELQNTLWEDGGSLIPYHINETRVQKSCLKGLPPIRSFYIDYSKISTSGC
ncbi:MAG: ABC transporter substrate-binding protein [Chloroflexota bacterium]